MDELAIKNIVSDWFKSLQYKQIQEGESYYRTVHKEIIKKKRELHVDGQAIENPHLTNHKLIHPFVRKIVRQKVGYLLGKPLTLSPSAGSGPPPSIATGAEAPPVQGTSEAEQFIKILQTFFDQKFYNTIRECAKESVYSTVSWLHPYYDEEGLLQFRRIPATQIIPIYAPDAPDLTRPSEVIRIYATSDFDRNGNQVATLRAKHYTRSQITNYVLSGTEAGDSASNLTPEQLLQWSVTGGPEQSKLPENIKVLLDPEVPYEYNWRLRQPPQEASTDSPPVTEGMWTRIPFIPIRYNSDGLSLLDTIKSLVDDYDQSRSRLSDLLADSPNGVNKVTNYDGQSRGEFVRNLTELNSVFLRENGDYERVNTILDVAGEVAHITQLRKDIYEFGGGVNTVDRDMQDTSGQAMKFIYADLDTDCQEFGQQISLSLEQAVWFIRAHLALLGEPTYPSVAIDFLFNTDISINEKETIENIRNSVGILSTQTLIENHPYVVDAIEEQRRVDEDPFIQNTIALQEQQLQTEAAKSLDSYTAGSDGPRRGKENPRLPTDNKQSAAREGK